MPLDEATIKNLRRVREEIEEILEDARDIIPPDFRITFIARYCGYDEEVKDMVWTEDVHDDVIAALEKERDNMEEA